MKLHQPPAIKHKPVTLSIQEDVVLSAKSLNLNVSQAAEDGIRDAVRKAHAEAWLRNNRQAIDDYNRKIREQGIAIPARWAAP